MGQETGAWCERTSVKSLASLISPTSSSIMKGVISNEEVLGSWFNCASFPWLRAQSLTSFIDVFQNIKVRFDRIFFHDDDIFEQVWSGSRRNEVVTFKKGKVIASNSSEICASSHFQMSDRFQLSWRYLTFDTAWETGSDTDRSIKFWFPCRLELFKWLSSWKVMARGSDTLMQQCQNYTRTFLFCRQLG